MKKEYEQRIRYGVLFLQTDYLNKNETLNMKDWFDSKTTLDSSVIQVVHLAQEIVKKRPHMMKKSVLQTMN